MTILAVTGDVTTTTAVAIASSWRSGDDVVVVEADPTGGDLAAWFDVPAQPSLSTVVTQVLDGSWREVEGLTRLTDAGLRVLTAPIRSVEAETAVAESARSLVPSLAALRSPVAVVDVGAVPRVPTSHPFIGHAEATVVVHRQATQSARAAGVRLQRLGDELERLGSLTGEVVVAVVGAEPFDVDAVERFVADHGVEGPVVGLPVDVLAAATLAGRSGVSARRLARLPLMKASVDLAERLRLAAEPVTDQLWRSA